MDTDDDLRQALDDVDWDIVVSDCQMPQFSGMDAIVLIKKAIPDLPVVMVFGAVGEEVAVDLIKAGAADFVPKDTPMRLGRAIKRELGEVENRRRRKQLEERLRSTQQRLDTILNNDRNFDFRTYLSKLGSKIKIPISRLRSVFLFYL